MRNENDENESTTKIVEKRYAISLLFTQGWQKYCICLLLCLPKPHDDDDGDDDYIDYEENDEDEQQQILTRKQ